MEAEKIDIEVIDGTFSICRLKGRTDVPTASEFTFIGITDEEISLVCRTGAVPKATVGRNDGWKMMRISGTLDFSLVGVLSGITAALAEARIGIFAISTFNTDYILVKDEDLQRSVAVLRKAGYGFGNTEGDEP